MVKERLIKYICYSISFILSLTLLSAQAYADTSLDSTFCNVNNLITGTPGKIIAGTVLVSTGVGFFVGKVSWGLLIASTMGIGVMFGAPTVVSALSGETLEECEQAVSYTITNDGSNYYSCPAGYSGENCDTCATGYTGSDCSSCDTGYVGNQCDECDSNNGYSAYNGSCYQSCTVSGIAGTSVTTVYPGSGEVPCNAAGNYSGSVSYICDSSFTPSGSCSCTGNFDAGSSCSACIPGYDIASGCSSCDTNYTNVGGSCHQDCTVTGVPGIANGTPALPASGSLTCDNNLGYDGSIGYTCSSGVFNTNDSCNTVSTCSVTPNNSSVTYNAPSGVWKKVIYAAFGMTTNCVPDNASGCNSVATSGHTISPDSVSIVENECLGKSTCTLSAARTVFFANYGNGGDPCPGKVKYLDVIMSYGP